MNTAFIPGPIDNQTRLESSATKTATFNGTALDLGSGFAPSNAGQRFSAVVKSSALDLTDLNETYTFKVQESSDNSAWTDASPAVAMTAAGTVAIPAFISKRYVRVVLTAGGTTPSVTYEAWLVPHQ